MITGEGRPLVVVRILESRILIRRPKIPTKVEHEKEHRERLTAEQVERPGVEVLQDLLLCVDHEEVLGPRGVQFVIVVDQCGEIEHHNAGGQAELE